MNTAHPAMVYHSRRYESEEASLDRIISEATGQNIDDISSIGTERLKHANIADLKDYLSVYSFTSTNVEASDMSIEVSTDVVSQEEKPSAVVSHAEQPCEEVIRRKSVTNCTNCELRHYMLFGLIFLLTIILMILVSFELGKMFAVDNENLLLSSTFNGKRESNNENIVMAEQRTPGLQPFQEWQDSNPTVSALSPLFPSMMSQPVKSSSTISDFKAIPTTTPSIRPTDNPSTRLSHRYKIWPTIIPSRMVLTKFPTIESTQMPTVGPTLSPTRSPTEAPTSTLSYAPTAEPSNAPTNSPISTPTDIPTNIPTAAPTDYPTKTPSSDPTIKPTYAPTTTPTHTSSIRPTDSPAARFSYSPTFWPTVIPSKTFTHYSTIESTQNPTAGPSMSLTIRPTYLPTSTSTHVQTARPTKTQMKNATSTPIDIHTNIPTAKSTLYPTKTHTGDPTTGPTNTPTFKQTDYPTMIPVEVELPPINLSAGPTFPLTKKPTTTSNIPTKEYANNRPVMIADPRNPNRNVITDRPTNVISFETTDISKVSDTTQSVGPVFLLAAIPTHYPKMRSSDIPASKTGDYFFTLEPTFVPTSQLLDTPTNISAYGTPEGPTNIPLRRFTSVPTRSLKDDKTSLLPNNLTISFTDTKTNISSEFPTKESSNIPTVAQATATPTLRHSQAPTESTENSSFIKASRDSLILWLQNLTTSTSVTEPFTPQWLAYKWLMDDDQTSFNLTSSGQRFAIVALDYAAHSSFDPAFAEPHLHECEWDGIVCDNFQVVTEIDWSRQKLTGYICPELAILDSLHNLDLAQNRLHGSLEAFWMLPTLRTLYLHDNLFSGPISRLIGNMINLESLYLGHNSITGSLPTQIGGVTKPLRYLNLHHNRLSGAIPNNLRLPKLFYLDLGRNTFAGSLPLGWSSMKELRHLYLDGNQITGSIPRYFSMLGNGRLKGFYVNNNLLVGNVPAQWGRTWTLRHIDVHGNLLRKMDQSICDMSVFAKGRLVELKADCNICKCKILCRTCMKQKQKGKFLPP